MIEWRPIEATGGLYEVSQQAVVRRASDGFVMKCTDGLVHVKIGGRKTSVSPTKAACLAHHTTRVASCTYCGDQRAQGRRYRQYPHRPKTPDAVRAAYERFKAKGTSA